MIKSEQSKTLDDIWKYCENEQIRIYGSEEESDSISEYEQGMILAYRKIQREIRNKCSDLGFDKVNIMTDEDFNKLIEQSGLNSCPYENKVAQDKIIIEE